MMYSKGLKTHAELKCNFCGKQERLNYLELAMWLCEKDYNRILSIVNKMKKARTRYKSVESWINAHHLRGKDEV
jgi:hypothetical protein